VSALGVAVAVGLGVAGCRTTDQPASPPPSSASTVAASPGTTAVVVDPNAECDAPVASAEITGRAPNYFVVTNLEGTVENPSSGAIHVSTIDLDFEPGIPKGVKTASLSVPVDLTIEAGATDDWTWEGTVEVRPFHDDAPQPVVKRVTFTWTAAGQAASCPDTE
jgi:hypothetical protein